MSLQGKRETWARMGIPSDTIPAHQIVPSTRFKGSQQFLAEFMRAKHRFEFGTGKSPSKMFVSKSDLEQLARDLDSEGIGYRTRIVVNLPQCLEVCGIRTYAVVEDGVMVAA